MIDARRIEGTLEAVADLPAWYGLVGGLAGIAVAVAVVRARDRRAEVVLLAGCGLVGAGAAVPDTEVIAVAILVLLAAGTGGLLIRGRLPSPVAVVTGILVTLALWNGARGRPGTILLAPVVVAPVVLAAGSRRRAAVAGRALVAAVIVFGIARLTGLGDGMVAPTVGGIVGAALLGLVALAHRRPPRA